MFTWSSFFFILKSERFGLFFFNPTDTTTALKGGVFALKTGYLSNVFFASELWSCRSVWWKDPSFKCWALSFSSLLSEPFRSDYSHLHFFSFPTHLKRKENQIFAIFRDANLYCAISVFLFLCLQILFLFGCMWINTTLHIFYCSGRFFLCF